MKFPVANNFRITQYYSLRHKAIDIAPEVRGAQGIHLYSPVKGRVLRVVYARWRWNWAKDQWIEIQEENGYRHYLGHMVRGSVIVKPGQHVEEGQAVGIMGTTGKSSGIHTHYRIRTPGNLNINPIDYYAARGIVITNTKVVYPVTSYAQYKVQKGDTLSKIGRKYGHSVASLLAINPQITDANFIFPGQIINLKGTSKKVHVVKRGDNMWNIAKAYNIPYAKLISLNQQIKNPALINIGEKVNIQ